MSSNDENNFNYRELEQSLINFLLRKRDIEEKVSGGSRRIRSLSFKIDSKNPPKVYFTVQLGMCEASFNTDSGLKEKGSCYGLERYIKDWYDLPTISAAIKNYGHLASRNKLQDENKEN